MDYVAQTSQFDTRTKVTTSYMVLSKDSKGDTLTVPVFPEKLELTLGVINRTGLTVMSSEENTDNIYFSLNDDTVDISTDKGICMELGAGIGINIEVNNESYNKPKIWVFTKSAPAKIRVMEVGV